MIPAYMDTKKGSWTHMQTPEKGQQKVFIRQRAYRMLKQTRVRTRSQYKQENLKRAHAKTQNPKFINSQKTISTGTKANMMN